MKKICITLIIAIILAAVLNIVAFAAAPTVTLSASATSVPAGSTVTVTVKVKGCSSTSLGIIPSYDTDVFELVSGEWLVSGAMLSDFSDGCAVIAYTSPYDFNGNVFKFTLKAKSGAKVDKFTVKCEVSAEGYSVVNPSTTISIACKTHSYSSWEKVSDTQHKHACSVCGNVETSNHTWNSGSVIKAATCKETGVKTYTCTGCGATKTETIQKTTAHSYGNFITSKTPGCTTSGTETATCSVCGHTISRTVPATGHSFGAWQTTKNATCTEAGSKLCTCKDCGATKEFEVKALGHDLTDVKTIKEATYTETGLKQGTCKHCGQTIETVIPKLDKEQQPTEEPTFTEVPTATPAPTAEPTVTVETTPEPTATPESTVTAEPTLEPTATPETTITAEPTPTSSQNNTETKDAGTYVPLWLTVVIAVCAAVISLIVTSAVVKKKAHS